MWEVVDAQRQYRSPSTTACGKNEDPEVPLAPLGFDGLK